MEASLSFGGRDVADRPQDPPVVEPIDPFQGGVFDGLEGSPWSTPVDHLGLVKAIDGFRQGVVVAVADAADRGLDPGVRQALSVLDADVLNAPVRMVNQAAVLGRSPFMQGRLQGVEHEGGMGAVRDTRQPTMRRA